MNFVSRILFRTVVRMGSKGLAISGHPVAFVARQWMVQYAQSVAVYAGMKIDEMAHA
jgi:hypothetical protein